MDDCDYMSDDFLVACEKNDIRPGLVHKRNVQRQHIIEKKKHVQEEHQKMNAPKVLAASQLNKGLSTALGPENKGFSMMEKMGFKPGSSLGASQCGIIEPVPISIKNDRFGLGRKTALQDIMIKKKVFRDRQEKQIKLDDFRAGMSKKFREREIESDLLRSQKSCYKFDKDCNLEGPEELWFWPKHLVDCSDDLTDSDEEDASKSANDEFTLPQKLEILTVYLRKTYLYCLWCGVQFDDEKDLCSACPGPTRDDH